LIAQSESCAAIILAAGRGSRLGELGNEQPKCLLTLAGRTLLEWQMAALKESGVTDIGIVRGYRKEQISPSGCTLLENSRWHDTNMVETLVCASEILANSTCVVSYADIVYHPSIVSSLLESNGDIAMTYDEQWLSLWRERFEDPLIDAESLKINDGQIVAIGARVNSVSEIEGQYMGLLKFTPSGWHQVEAYLSTLDQAPRDRLAMTDLLSGLIDFGCTISGVAVSGKWCEVDDADDLGLYEARIAQDAQWKHDWRW
jgi:choline kinase